jgi:deoxycytidylate deaminase
MSPRHDTYMTLCLEQARQSSLHYRHGCIIVRGGKVIGKGYNHYRPGFNSGALKNGRTASSNVRMRVKQTKKQKPKHTQSSLKLPGTPTFSGGHLANSPLSMHSEMMAIHSALSLSAHDSGFSARSTA